MSRDLIIECRDVWKVFGTGADAWLRTAQSPPTHAELDARGYVAGVRAASFDVAKGETFVIMGLSGSGKSTLVRCLSRLIEPTTGTIQFDGEDLLACSERELMQLRRHKMGMVFQHFALLPHLSVFKNVSFPLEIQGVTADSVHDRVMSVIDLVGLSGREDYYPRELSGGQQQRVGIARSLVSEPNVWFLDEPFSALDPLIRREMQDEFLNLRRTLKKTIVFITHDFDEAIRLADRIAIMNAGSIIQIGTPEQLVQSPANDYVAEFTRDVPRAKVLSVSAVMRQTGRDDYAPFAPLAGDCLIESIPPALIHQDKPLAVVDANDKIVGELHPRDVLDLVLGAAQSTTLKAAP